ncbi:hypothetical protein D0Z08_19535 [Nocardioides immobilis]|uniref:DUF2059 domain-containing protein n=1 Tax=Nocardioides immobilis TaxID=2049295 RepID=A0A417XYH9_9ACTN|nr:DUF5663 domain-containing protein [Nocardioides immobilis]RHW25421.1 hypothetical protein D0Z08_19535 [Nocardioides immobilis]
MFHLNDDLLVELGLGALGAEDKRSILAHMYETLELRVGMELARQMTNAQLDEFEVFIDNDDQEGSLAWLSEHFPHYRQVVAETFDDLKAEIKGQATAILAEAGS